ncbi:MAG TPA: hypothetical protein VEM76_04035 [Anaeromyxobacteraceae bacterium]|nr:hypothetical protein [Anaeromyxobacteraceae bacterium]
MPPSAATPASPRPARRLPRATLLAAAAASALALGCRGPTAASASSPGAAEAACGAAPALLVESSPRLLVTPAGGAFLLLGAGPLQAFGRGAWSITYAAAPDRSAAAGAVARQRLGAAADILFGTYQLLAEAEGLDLVSVTALFGAPGERGLAEQIWYRRDQLGWKATAPLERPIQVVPSQPASVGRELAEEGGAREIAREFLLDVDHADYDAAWQLSSAVVKATFSRAAFERQLRALPTASPAPTRQELCWSFPATGGGFIPGAELEVWFARATAAGGALDAVRLRLDDDMTWRVASLRALNRT